jgi:two-component system cell cycle sensor histidine kinase/response regulator CckA
VNTTTAHGPPSTTILVCEDDEQLRILVEVMLTEHGYRVLLAARAEQALELAAAHPDAVDVLVTDVELPQMSGPELVGRLQAKLPALEVLMLSGYPSDAIPGLRLPDGSAFLQKPFTETSLLEKIHRLLDS